MDDVCSARSVMCTRACTYVEESVTGWLQEEMRRERERTSESPPLVVANGCVMKYEE